MEDSKEKMHVDIGVERVKQPLKLLCSAWRQEHGQLIVECTCKCQTFNLSSSAVTFCLLFLVPIASN